MLSQPEHYRRDCNARPVIDGTLVIARRNAPKLLQSQRTALHDIAASVTNPLIGTRPTAITALLAPMVFLIVALGDHMAQPTLSQQTTARGVTVALVQVQVVRPLARTAPPRALDPNRVQRFGQALAVVALPDREDKTQRASKPIGDQMDLGRWPAPTGSNGLVVLCVEEVNRWLVRYIAPFLAAAVSAWA